MAKKSFGEVSTAFFTGHRSIDAKTQDQIAFVLDYLLKTMVNMMKSSILIMETKQLHQTMYGL